jgi:5,10-methylenetetrahydrofolate reductase
MARSLSNALRSSPLFFEPVPPAARLSPDRAKTQLAAVVELIRSVPRIDAVDVPELVDENHEGRPYYRTGDTRDYARRMVEGTGREVIVNKVVAHLASPAAVEGWIEETVARGIHHVILVGGTSRYIPYPGPTVVEANRVCLPILDAVRGALGNITIPQRAGEAHRMLAKTRAGASFFTTQILFDSDATGRMLLEYDGLCREAKIPPATLLLSVAPLADDGDVEFVRWLGADVPAGAEQEILSGPEATAGSRSVAHALRLWSTIDHERRQNGVSVPLGVNVEQISIRHLGQAGEMVRAFADLLPREGTRSEGPPPPRRGRAPRPARPSPNA